MCSWLRASCLLPHHGQAWPFSPDLLSALMIINGSIPYIAFAGVLLYEARTEGVLCSKKTSSIAAAAVVPVDLDSAGPPSTTSTDDVALDFAATGSVRSNNVEAKDLEAPKAGSKDEQAASV